MPYSSKEQQREYMRKWVAKRRADFFADKSCVKCGSTDRMELDHIDPEQKVEHRIWSWSNERRKDELAKCQVLCEECHKDKTAGMVRGDFYWVHGWRNTYRDRGCRCRACTVANTVRRRLQRWGVHRLRRNTI